jgi:glucose/arabinose dehydrogenase
MRRVLALVTACVALAAVGVVPEVVPGAVPTARAVTAPAQFVDQTVVPAVSKPTGIAFMPDGRMLVATQPGRLLALPGAVPPATQALDLGPRLCTNSERGVLGVAADPDPATKAVYLFYTQRGSASTCPTNASGSVDPAGSPRNRVSRFVLRDDNTIDPASETVLLDGIYASGGYHNAGDLHVGKDGMLYVSTGDGGCDYRGGVGSPGGSGCGGANDSSRDRNILNGKILRITRSGGVPADNPFLGAGTASCRLAPAPAGTVCQETWGWGLRNPFRMAFDPNATGTVFRINDVGQDAWEEVNPGVRGADYGWNAREGHCAHTGREADCGAPTPPQYTDPFYDYGHSTGCSSITGGAFVPDGIWPAAYTGAYLYSDYVCGTISSLTPTKVRADFITGLGVSSAAALAFGPYGAGQALYYTTYAGAGGGEVHRVSFTGVANRPPTAVVSASPATGAAPLLVTLSGAGSADPDGDTLSYLWDFGDGTTATTSTSSTTHSYRAGTFTASLRTRDPGGLVSAPATATVGSGGSAPTVTITSPAAGLLFTSGVGYTLSGSATDAQDGALPPSALNWTIVRRHNTHTHPFLGPVTGGSVDFVAPGPEDLAAAATSDLEIRLTATDSSGLTSTTTRAFAPRMVDVTLATAPAGRTLTVNGAAITGPTTVRSWAGYALQLGVPAQTDASGQPWVFTSWSDGGAASHSFTTPAAAATLTATLGARAAAPGSVAASQTGAAAATITWQPPAATGGAAITGYRVSRDGVDSAGEGAYTTTVTASTRSFTMTRLVSGRSYTLSVRAITAAGEGAVASRTVPVAADAASATDDFARTVSGGWGSAPVGGAWTVAGAAANLAVSGGAGVMTLPPSATRSATLGAVPRGASDVRAVFSLDAAPTGGGTYATVIARQVGADRYTASAWLRPGGAVVLVLQRGSTVLATAPVPGLSASPGARITVRVQALGSGPTTLRAKAWAAAQPEPAAWQSTATDATPTLQAAGVVGLQGYVSSSATAGSVIRFDDFSAGAPQ